MRFESNKGKSSPGGRERSLERMSAKSEAGGAGLMTRTDPLGQPGEEGEAEPHHEAIRAHLQAMHEETGHGHSHVEHHGDGTHTSHHIGAGGEMSGPHHHASDEEMAAHMSEQAGGMGSGEDEGEEPEYE